MLAKRHNNYFMFIRAGGARAVAASALAAALFGASEARADKIEVVAGFFSIAAQTSAGSGSVSGPGAYQLGYFHPLTDHLDLGVGYTLIMSSGIGGDLGFGPDLGVFYYPLSMTSAQKLAAENVTFEVAEQWRPYAGLEFQQRNFEATKSSYAGFGPAFGVVKAFRHMFDLKGEVRFSQLQGPDNATATEMDILCGVSMPF
jgi:hypothetical protein